MTNKKAIHAYFTGMVQGVGFRFTARDLAERYSLGGWVKNCSDGRVELIACGDGLKIEAFLNALYGTFERHISEQTVEPCDPPSDCHGFQIKF
jgi:acylphosphatase